MSPIWEIALRSIGAFFALLVITRIVGKEQLGQLTVSDFANAIAIGSIAASMATDHKENVNYYIIGIIIFGSLTYLTNLISLKYRPARKMLEGEPTVMIHNGKVLEKNMSKERYSMDNLTMQLREKNIFNIADVEFAVLEPNGRLSVLLKSNKQPLTASDLKISTNYIGIPSELIVDGKLIKQNLTQNNLSEQWLMDQLKKQGIHNVNEVTYASLDTSGNLFVDKKQDDL
ncbi:protein of unknown function DUF421 [Desulforamulus reducens MI-1]|uniref:DUF421 domain-containing protein n=1 Tax=Desulforamulus reducens (strain ATCC BAA-1160 / DSM 100696 / MI-1) TaxID=349161 RepID=A4J6F2_DESRM|nr:DUF421 domain-containing protein [Desulforamulus reducens]ABO50655.1 protein of unknown function DUF421 [Desulforamulus reducens MI-1]